MSLFMISSRRGLGDDYIRYIQDPAWRQMGPVKKIKPSIPVSSPQSPKKKRVYKRRMGTRVFKCDFCHNKFERFMRMDAQPLKYCPNCTQSVRSKNSRQHRKSNA